MSDDIICLVSTSSSSSSGDEELFEIRKSCVKSLVLTANISEARALELLDSTEEEHSGRGETAWLEGALCLMVHDMEVEAEAKEVSMAMQASMHEKEELEKSRPSLADEDMQTILKLHSESSKIASTLLGLSQTQMPNLAIDTQLLLDWLGFEKRCYRWYPLPSRGYFTEFSSQMNATESPNELEHLLRRTLVDLQDEIFSFPDQAGGGLPSSFAPYQSEEVICLDTE